MFEKDPDGTDQKKTTVIIFRGPNQPFKIISTWGTFWDPQLLPSSLDYHTEPLPTDQISILYTHRNFEVSKWIFRQLIK